MCKFPGFLHEAWDSVLSIIYIVHLHSLIRDSFLCTKFQVDDWCLPFKLGSSA